MQTSLYSTAVKDVIRELEHQVFKLDTIVMKTPTGQVREDLTEGIILIKQGIESLLNVC